MKGRETEGKLSESLPALFPKLSKQTDRQTNSDLLEPGLLGEYMLGTKVGI